MEKQVIDSPIPALRPAQTTPAQLIDRLIKDAFAPSLSRLERSPEYVNGVRTLLLQKLIGKPLASPFPAGTAAADAFYAGVDEGRSIHARNLMVIDALYSKPPFWRAPLQVDATGSAPTHRLEIRRAATGQWAGRIFDTEGEEVAGIGGCTSPAEVEQGAYDAGFSSLDVIEG
jgi:hypothetical protein